MSTQRYIRLIRSIGVSGLAVFFAVGLANAQTTLAHNTSSSASAAVASSGSWSSSLDDAGDAGALPASPSASASGGAQGGGYQYHSIWSRITAEVGGGFNAPSSSSSNYITWGGNLKVGAGYRFTPRLSAYIDYDFIDDKLPGRLIAETGANGGYAHIWSFTLNPRFNLFPKSVNDVYVTGGGGFFRKVTSFTDPAIGYYCDYFYCAPGVVNQVVGHFSSNQGGWSIGSGFEHRFAGDFGDGRMKVFAEVRYLDVLTPASAIAPNGLGVASVGADTKLIPVTFGVSW